MLDEDGLRPEHDVCNDAVLVAPDVENNVSIHPVDGVEHLFSIEKSAARACISVVCQWASALADPG
ncbi:hypothetical protein WJ968_21235 [Achromobacter xylosoxidans]